MPSGDSRTLAQFEYDGLGRLVRTTRQSRGGAWEVEDYYYDGVRRIQERRTAGSDAWEDPNSTYRDYVWGPGYVDEILTQVSRAPGQSRKVFTYLQDAAYNVIAVLSNLGNTKWQYVYEPYGEVVFAEAEQSNPALRAVNRVGHQGLFFERFLVEASDTLTSPMVTAGVVGIYHNRYRDYIPALGRFASRDPFGAAAGALAVLPTNGGPPEFTLSPFNIGEHYQDGVNLYGYLAGDPVNLNDAPGLFSMIELGAAMSMADDMNMDSLDRGMTLLGALSGFANIVAERNIDLEMLAESAGDDDLFDMALADWEESSLDRSRRLTKMSSMKAGFFETLDLMGLLGPASQLDLPPAFAGDDGPSFAYADILASETDSFGVAGLPGDFMGEGQYQVYIGYSPDPAKREPLYVGITRQKLHTRELQHAGKYKLKAVNGASGLTRKQARALEEAYIMANKGRFDNKISSISRLREWRGSALKWAGKFSKSRGLGGFRPPRIRR